MFEGDRQARWICFNYKAQTRTITLCAVVIRVDEWMRAAHSVMGGLTEARQLLRQHLVTDPVRILLTIIQEDAVGASVLQYAPQTKARRLQ